MYSSVLPHLSTTIALAMLYQSSELIPDITATKVPRATAPIGPAKKAPKATAPFADKKSNSLGAISSGSHCSQKIN